MHTSKMTTVCPHCGQVNDAVTSMTTEEAPQDGHLSLCVNESCWEFSLLENGKLRKLSEDERQEILTDIEFREFYNHFLRSMSGVEFDCGCQFYVLIMWRDESRAWERGFAFHACDEFCPNVFQMKQRAMEADVPVETWRVP